MNTFNFNTAGINYHLKQTRLTKVNTEHPSIAFAITTINSAAYIGSCLTRIYDEFIKVKAKYNNTEIFICINGTTDSGRARGEIKKFRDGHREVKIHILDREKAGKNSAINLLVETVKSRGFDIIHFMDDDIEFKKGSLLMNIELLIEKQKQTDIPILVGSHFKAIPHKFEYFRKKNRSFLKAVIQYFFFSIFVIPFEEGAHNPSFFSGQSMGAYTDAIPALPDERYMISDDAFIDQCFMINGKELLEQGMSPCVKPDNSIVYFELTSNYREWYKQNLRTFAGIWNGYSLFPEEYAFFAKYHKWAYSYIPDFYCSPPAMPFGKWILFILNRLLRRRVAGKVLGMMRARKQLDWGTVHSSKYLSKPELINRTE